jgi:hypothetical protein
MDELFGVRHSSDVAAVEASPAVLQVLAMADGLSISAGESTLTNGYALLALCFESHGVLPLVLARINVELPAIMEALADQGVLIPKVVPPTPLPPPIGRKIWFDAADRGRVWAAITKSFPPTAYRIAWGKGDDDREWISGPESVRLDDLRNLIMSAVDDPGSVSTRG